MPNLYFFCAGLSVLLALLLVGKPARTQADWLLAGWLGLVGVIFGGLYAEATRQLGWLVDLSSALVLLLGPILWLFLRTSSGHRLRIRWALAGHLLPFLLHLILIVPALLRGEVAPLTDSVRDGLALLKLASFGAYLLLMRQTLRLRQLEGASENIRWLFGLWLGLWGSWLLGVLSLIHDRWRPAEAVGDLLLNGFSVLLMVVAGYWGLRKTGLFRAADPARPEVRYARSRLSREQLQSDYQRLTQGLTEHRWYLDPDVSLVQLAEQLGISAHQLSQVINEQSGQHFTDLINGYRVEEVIRRLQGGDHRKLTLLALGLEAGFNSKASFNRAFKKKTGLTPSEFVKNLPQTA